MIIIQIIIIVIALSLLGVAFSGRQTHAAKAWKKLALCFFVFAMIIAALFPGIVDKIAHFVGVNRGSDLLLYVLILTFIGYVVNTYMRQQRERDVVYRLARKVALLDANSKYKINNKK